MAKDVECQHCGEMGLHWEEVGDRWFLFDEDEDRHECEHLPGRSTPRDDFKA
jgi:hypothetical protein